MVDGYSKSYGEAETRYKKYREHDPFPDIQPALLNSADIADYVRETGMIYPFHQKDLCGATYKVRLKGVCVDYGQDGIQDEKHIYRVGEDDSDLPNAQETNKYECREKVVLKPNSITFVTLEPVFQIPDYLVIRFNLKIVHVYKGLLLGTGPIIDPGFKGRLSIPLHNLTSNEYEFKADDSMIVLEFTKMSPNSIWQSKPQRNARIGKYIKTRIDPDRPLIQYINRALNESSATGIISSVDEVMRTAKNARKDAQEAAQKVSETIKKLYLSLGIGTVVAIIALFAAVFFPTYQLIKSVVDTQSSYEARIQKLERELTVKQNELKHMQQPSTEKVKNELATIEP